MADLYVIKIGGNIIDNAEKFSSFISSFASLKAAKILIHGGGKLATRLAQQMNVEQQIVDGRRITDAETLKIVTMVYAGEINKSIVARLQQLNCNAIGLTGADGNLIQSHKRQVAKIDYGFAGDIDKVNKEFLHQLLNYHCIPVISPITHDKKGQLLNTNADTIAQEVAKSMTAFYDVQLIYSFEKAGVLTNVDKDDSVIPIINANSYKELKHNNTIFAGMIPKLDNAFSAINNGVRKVIIGNGEQLEELIKGTTGTSIINE
jgi:acetylglutamate kinase